MDKYSVIYKALELTCKDLEVVNNPTRAPLNVIMSHYINKAENEFSVIDKYKPGVQPSNQSNVTPISQSNVTFNSTPSVQLSREASAQPSNNSYATEVLLNNVERLVQICQSIFNESNDYNLNYYKNDYLNALDKVISNYRGSKSNPSIDREILVDVVSRVIDSLHCAHYRMNSSKEQFDSGVVSLTSNYVHELSLML